MPSDPPVDVGDIPQRQFNTARRGLDPGEVRAYLHQLAETVAALQRATERETLRADAAERRAERAEHPDQQHMVELLGNETARVLDAARDAARDIRAKAEASAERLISEANDQAHERFAQAEVEMLGERSKMLAEVEELRGEAAGEMDRRRGEAEQMVDEMRREAQLAADGLRQEGDKERARALTEADDLRGAARDEARRMIAEAETMRERVLLDLDRRRRASREQLERLNGARSRLLAAYEVVRRTVDEATGELTAALPEAKVASDAAVRRIQASPEASLEELESDVSMARFAGLLPPRPQVPALDEILDAEPEPSQPPEVEDDDVAEREVEVAVPEVEVEALVDAAADEDFEVQLDVAVAQHDLLADHNGDVPVDDAVDAVFARLKGGVVGAPSDDVLLRQRNETLEPLERALTRRLKRVLADEQNEMLDLVRRGKAQEEEGLFPEEAAHVDRYGDVAADELHTAAYWGAAAVEGQLAGSFEPLIEELGRYLAMPLRERVARSIDETDGDIDELTTRLRALYREWKGQWVGDAVRHFVAAAYAQGAYEAADPEASLRWVMDPECGACPDAEDNALGGPLRKGEAFPTGHRAPPAHPGCRCLAMPISAAEVSLPARTAGVVSVAGVRLAD
jgi:DivIVA domain-containing protein